MTEITAVLREATLFEDTLHGKVYGDVLGRFVDGEWIHTSRVESEIEHGVFATRNNVYRVESWAERSKEKGDGGPAFPTPENEFKRQVQGDGMSLRDWFAGQALAEATREIWADHKYEDVAKRAYGIADAMLAERAK